MSRDREIGVGKRTTTHHTPHTTHHTPHTTHTIHHTPHTPHHTPHTTHHSHYTPHTTHTTPHTTHHTPHHTITHYRLCIYIHIGKASYISGNTVYNTYSTVNALHTYCMYSIYTCMCHSTAYIPMSHPPIRLIR